MQICEIRISEIKDGMIAAKDIYTDANELVITVNTVLNSKIVQRLKQYGIYRISVFKEEKKEHVETSREEKIKKSLEFAQFKRSFDNTVIGLRGTFSRILENSDTDGVAQLTEQVDKIMQKSDGSYSMFDMLNCIVQFNSRVVKAYRK